MRRNTREDKEYNIAIGEFYSFFLNVPRRYLDLIFRVLQSVEYFISKFLAGFYHKSWFWQMDLEVGSFFCLRNNLNFFDKVFICLFLN